MFYQLEEATVGSAPIVVRQEKFLVFGICLLGGYNRAVCGRHEVRLVTGWMTVFVLGKLEGEMVEGDVFIPTMPHDAYAVVREGES